MSGDRLLHGVSAALGWAYVICWGVSLYPPIILNHRLRSVEGISLDTTYLTFFGSICYLVSVCMLHYSPIVRAEYSVRHGGTRMPLTRFNDVVYGAHSLLMVLALLYQFYFAGYRRTRSQRVSGAVRILLMLGVLVFSGLMIHAWEINNTKRHYELVDVAQIFGVAKVFLSSVKYLPQIYWNHQRRSTKGFAISSSIIDIFGAGFSVSQLFLDGYLADDLDGVLKNPVKLLLALVTCIADAVFIVQKLFYREDDISIYNKEK